MRILLSSVNLLTGLCLFIVSIQVFADAPKRVSPAAGKNLEVKVQILQKNKRSIRENEPVDIVILVRNRGKAPVASSDIKLQCKKIVGAPCPVRDTLRQIKNLRPGQQKRIILKGKQLAKKGKYRISASASSGQSEEDIETVTLVVGYSENFLK